MADALAFLDGKVLRAVFHAIGGDGARDVGNSFTM